MPEDQRPSTDARADRVRANDALPAGRDLSPAARRALAEAEARRRAVEVEERPTETGGRKGPEPVRYGDWEKNGIISDF